MQKKNLNEKNSFQMKEATSKRESSQRKITLKLSVLSVTYYEETW